MHSDETRKSIFAKMPSASIASVNHALATSSTESGTAKYRKAARLLESFLRERANKLMESLSMRVNEQIDGVRELL